MGVFSWAALFGSLSLVLQAADTEAQSHARQSYDYLRQGQLADAEREIRESIRLAPRDALYHSALAGILHRSNRMEECAAEYSKALDTLPENSPVRQKVAEQLEQVDLEAGAELGGSGRYNEGLALSVKAAGRFPESARVLQMLGYFQSRRRMNVAAVKSYQRAVELDPSSEEASLGLGMAQSAAGMNKEAAATLESGVKRFPNSALHFQALGEVLLESSEPERASAMFEAALKMDANLAESHLQLGNLAFEKGDWAAARQHLQAAVAIAPTEGRIHFALARLYRRTGDPQSATREMQAFEESKAVTKR